MELWRRKLLVGTVPAISCAVLVSNVISCDPRVLLVLIGRLVVDDGVQPRILVERACGLSAAMACSEGAVARSVAKCAVGHYIILSGDRGGDCCQCDGKVSCISHCVGSFCYYFLID